MVQMRVVMVLRVAVAQAAEQRLILVRVGMATLGVRESPVKGTQVEVAATGWGRAAAAAEPAVSVRALIVLMVAVPPADQVRSVR